MSVFFVLLSSRHSKLKQLVMGGIRNHQVCARCRNHGDRVLLKGHKRHCQYKTCSCEKCLVTKDRQSFIAKEIAMHRYEIKSKSESESSCSQGLKLNIVRSKSWEETSMQIPIRTISAKISKKSLKFNRNSTEVRKNQLCSRCRNHGQDQLLRGHKNMCPFANCICEKCEITMKRREIMAKQIKDYRSLKIPTETASSPEINSPLVPDFKALFIEPHDQSDSFVDYEPVENRDLFFMIQSLYEKYGNQNSYNKVQLIYAFAHLANGKWDTVNKALDIGKNFFCENSSF